MHNLYRVSVILFLAGSSIAAPGFEPTSVQKISSALESRLDAGERPNIFIKLSQGTAQVLQRIQRTNFLNREQRLNSIHDVLVSHAERSQRSIVAHLNSLHSLEFKSFWVTNQIYVRNADQNLVQGLLSNFPEIGSIYEEFHAHIAEPLDVKNVTREEGEVEWGIEKIQVPEAWKEMGWNGTFKAHHNDILVGVIDTGVRFTHETIRDQFLGNYGWFDPVLSEARPNDGAGHGTHTTGTILGSNGIGVAPWAKWMTCRACPTFSCSLSALFTCGEFMLCPTLMDGSHPDCSKAPHLISNSWGAGKGSPFYNDVIDAWQAAGIIPIFSLGNFGASQCGNAGSPGDQPGVIGVTSTTKTDAISYFSSVGPAADGRLKPEVSGPGSDIISAGRASDTAYQVMSGTSMSCPHVSGIVVLLLTRDPNLTFDEIKRLIMDNADQNLSSSGQTCGDIPDDEYPNNIFGNGRVNAWRTVRAHSELLASKKRASLSRN